MKRPIHQILRRVHQKILLNDLSTKIAIYFHSVEPCSHETFKESILYFRELGYRFVSPQTFVNPGDESKQVFLSFDDNYLSWYLLLDLLEELGVNATFFVNTLPIRDDASEGIIRDYFNRIQHSGDRRTLSRAEVRVLRKSGHNIGSHTHSHLMLTNTSLQTAKEEIRKGKDILEDILGEEVCDFSFPFGMRRHFSRELRDYAVSIGIKTISNAVSGLQYKRQQSFNINRTLWDVTRPLSENMINLRIDGRIFIGLTGRSPIGI